MCKNVAKSYENKLFLLYFKRTADMNQLSGLGCNILLNGLIKQWQTMLIRHCWLYGRPQSKQQLLTRNQTRANLDTATRLQNGSTPPIKERSFKTTKDMTFQLLCDNRVLLSVASRREDESFDGDECHPQSRACPNKTPTNPDIAARTLRTDATKSWNVLSIWRGAKRAQVGCNVAEVTIARVFLHRMSVEMTAQHRSCEE